MTDVGDLGRDRRSSLHETTVLEPLGIIEILVTTCGALVSKQGLSPNDRYDAAVDVGMNGIARSFVEGDSADLREHLDAERLHADAVGGPFGAEGVRIDAVWSDRCAEGGERREDPRRIGRSATHEHIQILRCTGAPVDGHRPTTDKDEVCSCVCQRDENISEVVG